MEIPPLLEIHAGLLMIIRHVAHSDPQFLQLPPPLPVDLESLKDLILFAVVLEDPAHVVQEPDHRLDHSCPVLVRVIQQMSGVWVSLGRRTG